MCFLQRVIGILRAICKTTAILIFFGGVVVNVWSHVVYERRYKRRERKYIRRLFASDEAKNDEMLDRVGTIGISIFIVLGSVFALVLLFM